MLKHRPSLIFFLICFSCIDRLFQHRAGQRRDFQQLLLPDQPKQLRMIRARYRSRLSCQLRHPLPLPDTPEPVIILSPTPLQAAASQDATLQLTPSCTNRAELIKALNILDNAALDAGQSFAKIWRIKNTGTCVWSAGYALAFYSGEQMGGQPSIPLPSVVQPGDTVDLRVDLVAPLNQTSYTGNWVLQDAGGNVFGVGELGNQSISVTILVKAYAHANQRLSTL